MISGHARLNRSYMVMRYNKSIWLCGTISFMVSSTISLIKFNERKLKVEIIFPYKCNIYTHLVLGISHWWTALILCCPLRYIFSCE